MHYRIVDTYYLKQCVEPHIVARISERIGVPLQRGRVPIGPRADDRLVHFEFDGVSQDQQVGLLVSYSQTIKPGGVRKLHVDASILLFAPFTRRLMAFISDDVYSNFLNKCDGLLPLSRIEMFVCNGDDLPIEMSARIAEIYSAAKTEVGDKGKRWKLGKGRG
jgi:hypothetical protein